MPEPDDIDDEDESTGYHQSPLSDETMPPYEDWGKLYAAVRKGDVALARGYLEAGWKVNQIYHPSTPLIEAIDNKDIEMTALLLSYGADPNMCAYGYTTPLCSAVYSGSFALCEMLLKCGADPNKHGDYYSAETPLIVAIRQHKKGIFALLLTYEADPDGENERRESPRRLAEEPGNELFKSIIQNASREK